MINRRLFFTKVVGGAIGGLALLTIPKKLLADSTAVPKIRLIGNVSHEKGFIYAPYIPVDRHRVLVEKVKQDINNVFQKYAFEENCETTRQQMWIDLNRLYLIPCDWGTIPPQVGFCCVEGLNNTVVIDAIIRKGNTDQFTRVHGVYSPYMMPNYHEFTYEAAPIV